MRESIKRFGLGVLKQSASIVVAAVVASMLTNTVQPIAGTLTQTITDYQVKSTTGRIEYDNGSGQRVVIDGRDIDFLKGSVGDVSTSLDTTNNNVTNINYVLNGTTDESGHTLTEGLVSQANRLDLTLNGGTDANGTAVEGVKNQASRLDLAVNGGTDANGTTFNGLWNDVYGNGSGTSLQEQVTALQQDLSNYKTTVASTYLTQSAASSTYQPKGNYLTSHQSLSSYATKTYVDNAVKGASTGGGSSSGSGTSGQSVTARVYSQLHHGMWISKTVTTSNGLTLADGGTYSIPAGTTVTAHGVLMWSERSTEERSASCTITSTTKTVYVSFNGYNGSMDVECYCY